MTRIPVTFAPSGAIAWVDSGTTVADAAQAAGLLLPSPCGGRGVCGSCGVRVLSGELVDPDDTELAGLARAPKGIRLACRARVKAPVEVRSLAALESISKTQLAPDGPAIDLVAAVDLGTTSVAAVLIEAGSGRELARSSVANRQQPLGADVLTRISAALSGQATALRRSAEESVLDALRACAEQAGVSVSWITRLVVAGNSAMSGLFAGADVSGLAGHPFVPPSVGGPVDSPALSEALAHQAVIELVEPIASFVGGDTLAALVGTGMLEDGGDRLLVDLGTNAEIALVSHGSLTVASAAAGPAFEGAGISCGGPAAPGAVTSIAVAADGGVEFTVLGGGEPLWLSGSGVVSILATLLRLGHIDPTGLLLREGPLQDRYGINEAGVATFALGDGEGCLTFSQLDVRAVQLAKAAIQVGIKSVLASASRSADALESVLIAGAFGFSVSPEDLIAIGVLPAQVVHVSQRVGNAALDGAAVLALDPSVTERAHDAAALAECVDLASETGFNEAFLAAMSLEPYSA
jgi:uncharacterized 2Fe-2S/4Fe-4S cluster protein (DUF4445 family)